MDDLKQLPPPAPGAPPDKPQVHVSDDVDYPLPEYAGEPPPRGRVAAAAAAASAAAHRLLPRRFWDARRTTLAQMLILSGLAFCGPAMGDAISNLGGGGLASANAFLAASASEYAIMAVGSLIAASCISRWGVVPVAIIGAACFPLCVDFLPCRSLHPAPVQPAASVRLLRTSSEPASQLTCVSQRWFVPLCQLQRQEHSVPHRRREHRRRRERPVVCRRELPRPQSARGRAPWTVCLFLPAYPQNEHMVWTPTSMLTLRSEPDTLHCGS